MPTYDYECIDHGCFEADHSISETLDICPKCAEEGKYSQPPKRLISKSNFVLVGAGWGRDNYGK